MAELPGPDDEIIEKLKKETGVARQEWEAAIARWREVLQIFQHDGSHGTRARDLARKQVAAAEEKLRNAVRAFADAVLSRKPRNKK